jgi:hypothetical protein
VTVTNPALVLSGVNQGFGPQTGIAFNILNHIEPAPAKLVLGGAGAFCNCSLQTLFVDEQLSSAFPSISRPRWRSCSPASPPRWPPTW